MELSSAHLRYLLAIGQLSQGTGAVSSAQVARALQVSRPSVTRMLTVLAEKNLDELGDILEVLEELAHLQGWTDWEIRHARSEKAQRNGIFRERIFLEKVLED